MADVNTKVETAEIVANRPDLDDAASAVWAVVTAPGHWGLVLKPLDADALADYCRLAARKAKATQNIAEHGELVASPNGFPVANPWIQVETKARVEMERIAARFDGRKPRRFGAT